VKTVAAPEVVFVGDVRDRVRSVAARREITDVIDDPQRASCAPPVAEGTGCDRDDGGPRPTWSWTRTSATERTRNAALQDRAHSWGVQSPFSRGLEAALVAQVQHPVAAAERASGSMMRRRSRP
jgi:hypothetical protein